MTNPVPKAPSPRMLDLAVAVAALTREQGYPPSLVEISKAIGTNTARAAVLAHGARARGLIAFRDDQHRTIRVIDQAAIRRKRPAK